MVTASPTQIPSEVPLYQAMESLVTKHLLPLKMLHRQRGMDLSLVPLPTGGFSASLYAASATPVRVSRPLTLLAPGMEVRPAGSLMELLAKNSLEKQPSSRTPAHSATFQVLPSRMHGRGSQARNAESQRKGHAVDH